MEYPYGLSVLTTTQTIDGTGHGALHVPVLKHIKFRTVDAMVKWMGSQHMNPRDTSRYVAYVLTEVGSDELMPEKLALRLLALTPYQQPKYE
jgi:hypothetical protein